MQIHRLLEVIYILLDKKTITAKELADHFEVSQRTIYRDIDTLSAAGIPIYTTKGKGGGISLLDQFVLNKSILSEKEQFDILSSLQSMKALNVSDVEPVLKKLSVIFDQKNTSWIDVDFSQWGSSTIEKEKFTLLKTAILEKKLIAFDYYSSSGEKAERIIEPMKLLFKAKAWYVYGYCRSKNNFRLFKMTRIKNLSLLNEAFAREVPKEMGNESQDLAEKMVKLVLKIESSMAYRVYDEFDQDYIIKNPEGSFTVTVTYPENEWVYSYLLSFGEFVEVIEHAYVRNNIRRKLEVSLKNYLSHS